MVGGLDSSIQRPTADQAAAMYAAGVRVYGGYLPPGLGLESPWDQASFEVLQGAGLRAVGFSSGNDDPDQAAAIAEAWGVLGCLDDEAGIRAGSGWQQAWLDHSGFGVYGGQAAHGVHARFHVAALYPGQDPGATWPPGWVRPPGALGWQWQGTHDEFGVSVDRAWYDEWFATGGQTMQTMQVRCRRPDGGEDVYTIVNGQCHHVVLDFGGSIYFADSLPGSWSATIACGYRGQMAYFQGLGTDAAVTAFEVTNPGPGWTGPVAKP